MARVRQSTVPSFQSAFSTVADEVSLLNGLIAALFSSVPTHVFFIQATSPSTRISSATCKNNILPTSIVIVGKQDFGRTGNFEVWVGETLVHSNKMRRNGYANRPKDREAICQAIELALKERNMQ